MEDACLQYREDQIDEARALLRGARRVAALTWAGISAESGIDTFRGPDGAWSRVDIEAVATPRGFARDPARVWRWYEERRARMRAAEPNPGHRALASPVLIGRLQISRPSL